MSGANSALVAGIQFFVLDRSYYISIGHKLNAGLFSRQRISDRKHAACSAKKLEIQHFNLSRTGKRCRLFYLCSFALAGSFKPGSWRRLRKILIAPNQLNWSAFLGPEPNLFLHQTQYHYQNGETRIRNAKGAP